jgi:two-component system, OmpR family, sensor kinase
VSRIPIRLRLTLAFAIAMAVVLAATGAFLYLRLQSALDEAVDETLEARLSDAIALARTGPTGRTTFEDGFTEITIANDSERLGRYEVDRVPGVDGRVRVLADIAERTPKGERLVAVGASLEDRDEALTELLAQLLIVAPVALLLTSLLGYRLATAALRPVEEIRAEAAAISGSEAGRRLPTGGSRDEIARLAETLNAMLARLERALERERSFVADASHELRTPLALLKAELELALRKQRTAPELEQALRSAAAETDRVVRLAEDLLVLAQADDGRLPLRRRPMAVDGILAAVRDAFRPRADAAARAIDAASADGLAVSADRLRLEQALGNLVDNALRHGDGAVRLSAVETPECVELHVRDEGTGFPPEFLPRAFERFGRADEARTGGGAGLGLALAAAIAEAHGGSAHATNRDSAGADVWLAIPRD